MHLLPPEHTHVFTNGFAEVSIENGIGGAVILRDREKLVRIRSRPGATLLAIKRSRLPWTQS